MSLRARVLSLSEPERVCANGQFYWWTIRRMVSRWRRWWWCRESRHCTRRRIGAAHNGIVARNNTSTIYNLESHRLAKTNPPSLSDSRPLLIHFQLPPSLTDDAIRCVILFSTHSNGTRTPYAQNGLRVAMDGHESQRIKLIYRVGELLFDAMQTPGIY